MKVLNIVLKILFVLLLLMPAAGTFGLFPQPTADMYSNTASWEFISALMSSGYMMPLIALTTLVTAGLIIFNRTALAAVIAAPFTVNVIAFHAFLDKSLLSPATIPAYLLLALNLYFVWQNWGKYKSLI